MKILYKLTTRSRPDKMFAAISNIRAMALEKDPLILVTLDKNDAATNTESVRDRLLDIPGVIPWRSFSRNKIDAFNRDMEIIPKNQWDIVVATSDDIKFLHGFDEQIKKDALKAPDPINFVLWYGDGAEHGKILTVPIMSRLYYERLGYIYNPIYHSLFCDEEAIHVGEKLGKIYYSDAQIMEHLHPAWGKAEWDAQYRFTDSFYQVDKKTFKLRQAENFPI